MDNFWKYNKCQNKEILIGGRADKIPSSKFNKIQLAKGTKHELEHTKNRKIAREIAKDHLIEDRKYYIKLKRIGL